MKGTTIRGTVPLKKSIIWCDGKHKHQLINGRLKSGQLRTAFAQTYTSTFCKRLARDVKVHCEECSAFPFEDNATEDPYYLPEDVSEEDDIANAQRILEQQRESRRSQAGPSPKKTATRSET